MTIRMIENQDIILKSLEDGIKALEFLKTPECLSFIDEVARMIADCMRLGGKVLIAGNGGSLCDAIHFAEELTGQFRKKRKALPAIALSDPGHMSCVANDTGFDQVFARAVEAHGNSGDILVILTTSGNSANLIEAVKAAIDKEMRVVAFLGKTGGRLKGMADRELLISGFPFSDRIQEAHMSAIHIILEVLEEELFSSDSP